MQLIIENKALTRRWIYLIFGTFSLLFAGFIYAWSILKAPYAGEFGWNPAQLALNHTLTMVFVAVGNLSAGVLSKKVSSRILLVCSSVMVALGLGLASLLSGESIVSLYCSFALLCGTGIGAYMVAITSVVGDWFPDLKGICSSTMQLGFGFSSLLLGSLASYLMDDPDIGWRKTYLLLSVVVGAVMVGISLILKRPAPDTPLPPPRMERLNRADQLDISSREMLRRKGFWQYYMFCLMINGIGSSVISFATDFFLFLAAAPATAVLMVGLISVSNGLGRFVAGAIFDKTGRRVVMRFTVAISILSPIFLLIALPTNSMVLGAVGACLAGASFGCIPSSAAPIMRTSYGDTNFAFNYSIILTSSMPSSFVATLAGSILTNGGSYSSVFVILLFMAIMALVFCQLMKKP